MIVSRTPLRVSFVGGGTDLASFYREHGGAVISMAINKYVYVSMNAKFDGRTRASYSRAEDVAGVDELEHPIIRHALQRASVHGGVEVSLVADVPSRGTGLGSSSACAVGLINAAWDYAGQGVRTKDVLAKEACRIEIDDIRSPIGKQDQYACAHGGLNHIAFNSDETVDVMPLNIPPGLVDSLMLFYIGTGRQSSPILKRHHICDVGALRYMLSLVEVLRNDFSLLGAVMHEAWLLKRSMANGATSDSIDWYYALAREAGATGGKMLGAGGGGFMLLAVPPERRAAVARTLPNLRRVDFDMDYSGSLVIFNDGGRRGCESSSRAAPVSSAATYATA